MIQIGMGAHGECYICAVLVNVLNCDFFASVVGSSIRVRAFQNVVFKVALRTGTNLLRLTPRRPQKRPMAPSCADAMPHRGTQRSELVDRTP
jgi:hypothetical protein